MCHLFETFFNLLFLVSFSASVKVNLLLRLVFVIQIICFCWTRPKVFSFEKNSGGQNPPGPLSFITLKTKTEEELPTRLVFNISGLLCFPGSLEHLLTVGLSSVGLICKGSGTTWDLSTSMVQPGKPGSPPGPGTGPRREPSTSGAISLLPGVYNSLCKHASDQGGISWPGEGTNLELLVHGLSGHRHCE